MKMVSLTKQNEIMIMLIASRIELQLGLPRSAATFSWTDDVVPVLNAMGIEPNHSGHDEPTGRGNDRARCARSTSTYSRGNFCHYSARQRPVACP